MLQSQPQIFRRFLLHRIVDETGISGTGFIAEGIQFSTGRCVITWLTDNPSIAVYDSINAVEHIHGHKGKTRIEWIDAAI